MASVVFSAWKKEYPIWEADFSLYQRDDHRFQRIISKWTDEKGLENHYHACLDTKTGDIYLDCRRRKIFAKHILFVFAKPISLTGKALWHLSLIPVVLEVAAYLKGKQTGKDTCINSLKSMADIIRTPVYAVAIEVVDIAAVIIFPFSPNLMYYTRMTASKLDRQLFRTEKGLTKMPFSISPCFSPVYRFVHKDEEGLFVGNMHYLNTFIAEQQVTFRRNNKAYFNDCNSLFSSDKAYISKAAYAA